MNLKNILPKLNNQKGLTGVDIVVSMSILVMTVVVVTMIYVNIDLNSKSVNRTAGATRIATTMLEQIEKMYYDEVSKEFEAIKTLADNNTQGISYDDSTLIYTIVGNEIDENSKFFNIKIPKGYTIELTATNSYGSSTTVTGFDLVKKIDITVSYIVGTTDNNKKEISLGTVKERESIGECNTPVIDDETLGTAGIDTTSYEIVCVKYSNSLGNYVETTVNDTQWYNYTNKEWARILAIPISIGKSTYVDSSGNIKNGSGFEIYEYVWIPNYALKSTGSTEIYFRYSNSKYRIIPAGEPEGKLINSSDGSMIYTNLISDEIENTYPFDNTGVWRSVSDGVTNGYYSTLNSSQYGPLNTH